jgi:ribosomal protein L17
MFGFGKKEITTKKLREWQNAYRIEKIVEVAKSGTTKSRLLAIAVLEEVNMIQVKNELLALLDDAIPEIALRAADALESMGVVHEERERIKACRSKHQKS